VNADPAPPFARLTSRAAAGIYRRMMQTVLSRSRADAALLDSPIPAPGSPDELRAFAELQRTLAPMFCRVFSNPDAPRTVVVIPSMSLDHEELAKLTGASRYEERFLCLLMLLRLPATRVIYITSEPVAPQIVNYYLGLVRDVEPRDARDRLTMLTCDDASAAPLTEKILARHRLVARIRSLIDDPASSHLTCFTATALERTLAVRLGIPLYGCDPALRHLGTKSGSRVVFHRAGVLAPPGYEHLRGEEDVIRALVELKREQPAVRRAVIKLEEGFSGEGNAIFSYDDAPSGPGLALWVRDVLPRRVRFVAPDETWPTYRDELARMGGIVESFVSAAEVRSPSVQCRIDPSGATQIISTHDQVLGGSSGQVYLGCTFPAELSCLPGLHAAARRVTTVLANEGVVGRFGIDFVSTLVHNEWRHYAIEINIRKGGTTHPFLTLQLLTDGAYDPATGLFRTKAGRVCFYVASDNLCDPSYTALTPRRVISVAAQRGLAFHPDTERGVVFHLMGALGEFGKLGAVCIGRTREDAQDLFAKTIAMLRREAAPKVPRREPATSRSLGGVAGSSRGSPVGPSV